MKIISIICIMFTVAFSHHNIAHAENVFRPSNIKTIEQANQFIPDSFLPVMQKIRKLQAEYLNQVAQALRAIKQGDQTYFSASLIILSFLYGLLHAAGPGHGKAVISAYLLSNKVQLRNGIQMAFFASMLQAITAIAITYSGLLLFHTSVRGINQNFVYFEQVSYIFIAIFGLYLLISNLLKIYRRTRHTHHQHDADCDCGHIHIPAPQSQYQGLKQKILVIFSIGIRPCTGALIILVMAHSLGLYAAAIWATFVMALGTFFTISLMATFAVSLHKMSQKITPKLPSSAVKYYSIVVDGLKIGLSCFVILFGLLLIMATL